MVSLLQRATFYVPDFLGQRPYIPIAKARGYTGDLLTVVSIVWFRGGVAAAVAFLTLGRDHAV
jgi:hypothetical protein